jgi:signal transduction histidine kinase
MKIIEFKPEGKSTIITPDLSSRDDAVRNEVLIEILPLLIHKLKNKLTPILGYTQILKTRGNDDFSKERLARVEKNTTDLTDALNVMKEYCRPCRLFLKQVALDRIMEELAPEWQAMANAASARITIELEPGLPELPLDAGRMRVLLLNLADNAQQALLAKAGAEREIRLSARRNGSFLKLSVLDNGCGMGEEELASIWLPFFSGSPDRAGLGLTICERIIADHGAACAVFSTAGEFSRFEIDFPLPATTAPRAGATREANKRTRS